MDITKSRIKNPILSSLILCLIFSFVFLYLIPIPIANAQANDGKVLDLKAGSGAGGCGAQKYISKTGSGNWIFKSKIKTISLSVSTTDVALYFTTVSNSFIINFYINSVGNTKQIWFQYPNSAGGSSFLKVNYDWSDTTAWHIYEIDITSGGAVTTKIDDTNQLTATNGITGSVTLTSDESALSANTNGNEFKEDYKVLKLGGSDLYLNNWNTLSGFSQEGSCTTFSSGSDSTALATLLTNLQVAGSLYQNIDGTFNYGLPPTTFTTLVPPYRLGTTWFTASVVTTVFSSGTPNVYLYVNQAPAQQSTITNITSRIAEVFSKGVDTSVLTATITMGVYTVNTGGITPSSSYPLNLISSRSFTVANGTINTQITYKPNINICSNCYYAIAITTNSFGVYIYQTSNAVTMSSVANTDGNVATLPSVIQSYATYTPSFYLYGLLTFQAVTTTTSTTTIASGVTTTTVTTTSTLSIIDPNASGAIQAQQLVTYWPVWILPLIMGGMFGMIGVFLGMLFGVILGGIIGIIPAWVIFLLGSAIVLLILRREI